MSLNLDIIKLQYEIFDLEPEAIAVLNNISAEYITKLVEENKWLKNPLIVKANEVSDVKDLIVATDEYVTKLKDKLTVTSLLKQEILNPAYTKFEALLVYKAIDILENIDSENSDAAKNVKIITSVLNELLQNNANLISAKDAVEKTDSKVIVQIMNQVEKAS